MFATLTLAEIIILVELINSRVFRDRAEGCKKVDEAYLLAVARSAALPGLHMVAISSDKCVSFIRISYAATKINCRIGSSTKEKQPAPITIGLSGLWTMQFRYCDTISSIGIVIII